MTARARRARLSSRRLIIITGPFGSGKTELAVSYALISAAAGRATALVDLDIVNPYFRAQDHRDELECTGVRVVAPEGPLSQFELPAVSPEVRTALTEPSLYTIADVGGDPVGARILGAYRSFLERKQLNLWLVINPWRPPAVEGEMERLVAAIQAEAGLKADAIISSPNMGGGTTARDVREGHRRVAEYARELNLPMRFLTVDERLAAEVADLDVPLWPLKPRMRPLWEPEA